MSALIIISIVSFASILPFRPTFFASRIARNLHQSFTSIPVQGLLLNYSPPKKRSTNIRINYFHATNIAIANHLIGFISNRTETSRRVQLFSTSLRLSLCYLVIILLSNLLLALNRKKNFCVQTMSRFMFIIELSSFLDCLFLPFISPKKLP